MPLTVDHSQGHIPHLATLFARKDFCVPFLSDEAMRSGDMGQYVITGVDVARPVEAALPEIPGPCPGHLFDARRRLWLPTRPWDPKRSRGALSAADLALALDARANELVVAGGRVSTDYHDGHMYTRVTVTITQGPETAASALAEVCGL